MTRPGALPSTLKHSSEFLAGSGGVLASRVSNLAAGSGGWRAIAFSSVIPTQRFFSGEASVKLGFKASSIKLDVPSPGDCAALGLLLLLLFNGKK
jgi:hypothetical protein